MSLLIKMKDIVKTFNIGQPGENAHMGRLPRVPEEKATLFV